MSTENESKTPSQRALDELVSEARDATAEVGSDWDRVDAALFARVEREASKERALASHRGRPGTWLLLGGIAAAAAAAAVLVQPSVHPTAEGNTPISTVTMPGSAGDLTLQKGAGEVLLAGAKARTGAVARPGDAVQTRGAKAVFEAPGRVSWLLEDESSVTVERAGAAGTAVVLALRQGALEAQVQPVAFGEAFAVDVDGVRVAVHGTHLRVARDGDHVVVDLTEGVVSIGAPPKSGSTYGTLVTAPAHVEFRTGALDASITVDHATASVRTAADLDSVMDGETTASVTPPPPPAPRSDENVAPRPKRVAATASQPRAAVAKGNPNAESDLQSAVLACAAAPHSNDLNVTYSGKIILKVKDDGSVADRAIISPPINDDNLHGCVTRAIYASRFAKPGEHQVPIQFRVK